MTDRPLVLVPFVRTEAMTIQNAAGVAGVTPETVRRWAIEHDLGRIVGGRWMISRAAFRMYLDGDRSALSAYHAGRREDPAVRAYLESRS